MSEFLAGLLVKLNGLKFGIYAIAALVLLGCLFGGCAGCMVERHRPHWFVK